MTARLVRYKIENSGFAWSIILGRESDAIHLGLNSLGLDSFIMPVYRPKAQSDIMKNEALRNPSTANLANPGRMWKASLGKNRSKYQKDESAYQSGRYSHLLKVAACPAVLPLESTRFQSVASSIRKRRLFRLIRIPW